jgi:hypothetical protein
LLPQKLESKADDKLPLLLMIGGTPVSDSEFDGTLVTSGNQAYLITGNSGFTVSN